MPNLNKPTNPDKFDSPFVKYNICLPNNFKKALKYRDKYFHGSIPQGNKLGTFRANNLNRAFELQFLVSVRKKTHNLGVLSQKTSKTRLSKLLKLRILLK